MNKIEFDNVIEMAIETYGHTPQKIVAMEELSELIKEISKDLRGQDNIENILEEMADVFIMLEQLRVMYGLTDYDIQEAIDKKLERLEKRLANEDH